MKKRSVLWLASAAGLLLAALSAQTLQAMAQQAPAPSAEVVHALAPTGRLRAAINYGNTVLGQRDEKTGELTGVSVVIAKTLGERLHVPVDLVPFPAAGQVFDAMASQQWDIAFMAIDPQRAEKIDFSAPYVFTDGTYLVRTASPFQSVADLDHDGGQIAVAKGAAYDLFLSRNLKHATLVRAPTSPAAVQMFTDDKALDGVAGVRQFLIDATRGRTDVRVIADSYTRIDQAVALPRGHEAADTYIHALLEELKASGRIRAELDRTHQDGASVTPPSP